MGDGGAPRRVADLLADVASAGPQASWASVLVECCRVGLGAAGVGLAVTDAGGPAGVVAATPGAGQLGEDLQFALGEGPCWHAARTGRAVRAPDLATDTRWLHYAREASGAGIAGVFSVPLAVGAVRVGVLDLYRSMPGTLTAAQHRTLSVHAEAATAVLLMLQDNQAGDPADLVELADIRPVVHQAAGMVAVQLDVDLATALVRLRAHAFATGGVLREVAADVVARRLRMDTNSTGERSETRDDDEHT